jgi:hypothetical protein
MSRAWRSESDGFIQVPSVIKKDSDWMDLNINVLSEKTRDVE